MRTPGIDVAASALSGGNQQKLIVGREMSGEPVLLLAAHPTRGVDVGAQAAIWDALRTARAAGLAVLLISADLDELIGLSDTIQVILRGRLVGRADPRTVTPEELGSAMTGAGDAAEPAEPGPAGGRHAAGRRSPTADTDGRRPARRRRADAVPPDSGPGADPDLDAPLPGTEGPGLTGTGTTGTGDLANDPTQAGRSGREAVRPGSGSVLGARRCRARARRRASCSPRSCW